MQPKILLVDDDPDDQLLFRDAIKEINKNINCEVADDCRDALDRLKTPPPPDMIFLDLNMPVMNGFDCLVEMRKKENLKDVPVIIFTTTNEHSAIEKTHALGATAFLTKPASFKTLLAKLTTLLQMDFTNRKVSSSFSFGEFYL